MSYVYKETDRWQERGCTHILYTVGFYHPDGTWEPESDHDSREEAAQRVAYLNGSYVQTKLDKAAPELLAALQEARKFIDSHSEEWYVAGQELLSSVEQAIKKAT